MEVEEQEVRVEVDQVEEVTKSPKIGVQWPHKKDLCPSKKFF